MKFQSIVYAIVMVFLFSACQKETQQLTELSEKERAKQEFIAELPKMIEESKTWSFGVRPNVSQEEHAAFLKREPGAKYTLSLMSNKNFDGDWRKASAIVRQNNEDWADMPAAFMTAQEQNGAMLKDWLLKEESTPEVQEAMAYHLQALVDFGNHDYRLIARTLNALKGHWTSEEIRNFATPWQQKLAEHKRKLEQPLETEGLSEGKIEAQKLIRSNGIYIAQDAEKWFERALTPVR
ncbi:MAG: hypothetical protein JJT94_15670 [Bernardetiaceae bacterium]|nr:hypothetical protein [Bernardetiaceae bacterium]